MAGTNGCTPSTYTVIVRDQEFRLSKRQIEFDSPNFFTSCFLGSFQESSSKSVTLDRNPQLFAIILEYLSGYEILPLSACDKMDVAYVTRNLLVDADFYGLTRLRRLLTAPSLPPSLSLEWAGLARQVVTLPEVISEHLPPGIEYVDGALYSEHHGNQLPVLVSARDVPIRLSASRDIKIPKSEKTSFRIDYTGSQEGGMATSVKHPPTILAESVFQGGKMCIDDDVLLLSDFSYWWHDPSSAESSKASLSLFNRLSPLTIEPSSRPYARYEGVLWADEVLFTIIKRSSDAGDPVLHIKLADLKARTRGAVLSELVPASSRWKHN
ncbi:hypothetical protein GLOTRDRAFT_139027 [Gloeophyllum trabeum ATCC 11539]|uniref:BTB domain-containing protein n=1 Tax=Gloeophyllum trabeum (strain ATCC 11539 / FP-39264 / Madison 617) TaxID=670483 RepID=S7Q4M7_GLOTA|nr:uncharacterized protein GLOTRDRAFT_139027 [Gloeophyllum trabeum ATCC 11539]EPQ54438.1 hypothetical protein GLOTRDRAFT_139027 [Gloeophyllum trabeum ATCC 11539]